MLGPSGVKTNIRTGQPVLGNQETRRAEAEAKLNQAISQSMSLQAELKGEGGLVLEAFIEQIVEYAEAVLIKDPVYLNFLMVLAKLGKTINVVPMVMERHLKQFLPSYESRPAPQGTPGGQK